MATRRTDARPTGQQLPGGPGIQGAHWFLATTRIAYRAATEEQAWEDVLATIAQALDLPALTLLECDASGSPTSPAIGWGDLDHPTPDALQPLVDRCAAASGHVAVARTALDTRVATPLECTVTAVSAPRHPGGDCFTCLHVRNPGGEAASDAIGGALAAILPDLASARALAHAIRQHRLVEPALRFLLNKDRAALVFIDDDGRCSEVLPDPTLVAQYLDANLGEPPRAVYVGDDARLHQLVHGSAKSSSAHDMQAVILRPRQVKQPPAVVRMVTLTGTYRHRPARALLVRPALLATPSSALLRSAFELTAAEAALACALLDGMSLLEYAQSRSRSISTARSHLRNLLRKTATRRQAELLMALRAIASA